MTLDEAKAILGDRVTRDGGLWCGSKFLAYKAGSQTAGLDDEQWTADELEAIAVFMRSTQALKS